VALGDSAAAAPLVPDTADLACLRSTNNYPALVNRALAPTAFTDVTCSGATTENMTAAQDSAPPQFNALTRDTELVTVSIGGNDLGFADIVTKCSLGGVLNPLGTPCRNHYGEHGLTNRVAATAPKIAAVLSGIKQRAPKARIVLVGYLNMLPDSGRTCPPRISFARRDIGYLNTFENALNAMLATEARKAGVHFADNHPASATHDVCAADQWVEGLLPQHPAAPFHPNATGEQAMAQAVLTTLQH
jgi:lysophospholipase L1-like esterase